MRRIMAISMCIIMLGVMLGVLAAVSGCGSGPNSETTTEVSNVWVMDYSNGVYYFDSEGKTFVSALATFIGQHPELEFVAMTGDGNGIYGCDRGYFVVFKKK